ncbi:hypothetical protein NADE_004862 [Nannochloris sp. 'desiccata']|nr:hypothetical protein NADE_004862 [Chlorella desiccata (nom. nud.)]
MPKDDSHLTLTKGDTVFVPARIWPNEKPPKGKKGWEGQIVRDDPADHKNWVVSFKGDPTKYFFKKADVEKWTKTEFGATSAKSPGGPGPSNTTPASPSRKVKQTPRTIMDALASAAAHISPRRPPSANPEEKAAVIEEIETLLPLIPVGGLKSIRLDIRRMAGKLG